MAEHEEVKPKINEKAEANEKPKAEEKRKVAEKLKAEDKVKGGEKPKAEDKAKTKKRMVKNVTSGIAHILASFNNTIVTITAKSGNTIC